MQNVKIIIVGNQFAAFSNNQNILTYDQFQRMDKREKNQQDCQKKYQIYLGQGLSDTKIKAIYKKIQSSALAGRYSLIGLVSPYKCTTNPFFNQKCIISEPEKISTSVFKSFLMLDESGAEGSYRHIPSAALMEAAVQMVQAVSDQFFMAPSVSARKSFIIHQIHSAFLEYVFPLDVEFILKMEQYRYGLDGNFKAEATIESRQNEQTVLSFCIDFSVMEKSTLLNIENHLAASAVNGLIDRLK